MAKESFSIKEMLLIVMEKQEEQLAHARETNGKIAVALKDIEASKRQIDVNTKRLTTLEQFNVKLMGAGVVLGVLATYLAQFAFKYFFG